MAMDAKMSDGTRALIAFAKGGAADDAARVGAGEVVEENRRLRAMMQALQQGGFGEVATVEFLPTKRGGVHFVVCCASRTEVELAEVIRDVVREVFAAAGAEAEVGEATITGTEAAQ